MGVATITKRVVVGGLALALAAGPALARPAGGGSSYGSRGSSTFSAPPTTPTAPRTAQPMQRTETPSMAPRPGMAPPAAAAQPRRFGFGTGLMAGLLGAGLFGMLTGHGFFGGLGGLLSLLGLLVQVALVVGLAWLAIRFFRRRSEPAFAGAPAAGPAPMQRTAFGGTGGGVAAPQARRPITVAPEDYGAFERTHAAIQLAYGREDEAALSRLVTPEMGRYFADELADLRRRGLRNQVTEPKLLQGDLAEAWQEGPTEYATVAMRFVLTDWTVERATGRVVSGNATAPTEATEIWTFRRDNRGPWLLSALQQTG